MITIPHYDDKELERLWKIDLLTYLQTCEPDALVKISDSEYCTKEHGSLKISNGKWHWWSRDTGGTSALGYLMKVEGLPFPEAAGRLEDMAAVYPKEYSEKPEKEKKLILPERNEDNDIVFRYLTESRGIDAGIVMECFERNTIYESKQYHNAVFVGYDKDNKARYASYRCCDRRRIMGDCRGSSKEYSFRLEGKNTDTLHLFESAIDALSYASILKMRGVNWKDETMLSLSGVVRSKNGKLPSPVSKYLEENPKVKRICLRLDNDGAGREAADSLKNILKNRYEVIDEPPEKGKDVNDFLCMEKGIIKPITHERSER